MLSDPVTASYVDVIKQGRGAHDAAGFSALKAEAARWKADGHEAHVSTLRHYYEGNIAPHLLAHAKKRWPLTGDRMPMVPFNWARLFAENGAAVYDLPPMRYLSRGDDRLDVDGEGVSPEDSQRAADFAEMLKEAGLDVVMAEAERRLILAKTVFLRVHSDSLEAKATGLPPRTCVTPFWPSDVLVIPHPSCPTSLATAVCLMARVAGEDGVQATGTTWEVWTRAWKEDADGQVESFGPWTSEYVREWTETNGNRSEMRAKVTPRRWVGPDGAVSDTYPGKVLPWVAMHAGVAAGSPFLDADRNLVDLFNSINEAIMSELFAVDMNAATPLVRKSDTTGQATIALGPGMMPTIPTTDSIDVVPLDADFEGIRAAIRGLVSTLAVTNRQRADGLDTQGGSAPESGIALFIKDLPQMKQRLEAVARAVENETRPATGLLAIMVEVHDYWRGTSIADEGVRYCMEPQKAQTYEDPSAVQKRATDAMDAGLITKAKAAVLAGFYRSEEEAIAAIEKIDAEKAARAPSMLRPMLDGVGRPPFGRPMGDRPEADPRDARTEDPRDPLKG